MICNNSTLVERISAFVEYCNKMSADHCQSSGYRLSAPTYRADYLSKKWCRVNKVENGNSTCVYAFICLCDGETKNLGKLVEGSIHKPASYSSPARHSRGSVYSDDFGNCAGPYGIVYLNNR